MLDELSSFQLHPGSQPACTTQSSAQAGKRHHIHHVPQMLAYLQSHLPFVGRLVYAAHVTSSPDKTPALRQDSPRETVQHQVHWHYAQPYAIQRFANHVVKARPQMDGALARAHAHTPRRDRSTLLNP